MQRFLSVGVVLGSLALSAPASAFCGFYVGSAEGKLVSEATMVVLLRDGTQTVLSMRNDYHGPPEDFAMVVPVPEVLEEQDVKVLKDELFERVERLSAPRLVEYWEQDPCANPGIGYGFGAGGLGLRGTGRGGGGDGSGGPPVVVEAEFAVGEYDIVILSASDSASLDRWLRTNGYRIPEGAESVLRPYVESESKFFVAKVNVERVRFEDGHAVLSPLRVAYESESFSLPVRLGLLSSSGKQDLIVHILANDQRYELANYENVVIPTNLDVSDATRERFGEFYAALFDRTLAAHPGAVVTEYAWQATGCDPCPGPVLSIADITSLGGDVVHPEPIRVQPPGGGTIGLGNLGRLRPSSPGARVRTGRVVTDGALSSELVRRIVRRHINEVKFCYEQELRLAPALQGNVTVTVSIGADGAVTRSEVTADTLQNARVTGCVRQATLRWRFPAGERTTRVPLPFSFSSSGSPRPSGAGRARSWAFGSGGPFQSYVLTRLHYRYDADDLGEDLVFREAGPISGGREHALGEETHGASPADTNNFQGRYIIRHEWEGAIECEEPRRGVWGGRPTGGEQEPTAATGLAQAPRGGGALSELLVSELDGAVPEPVEEPVVEAPEAAVVESVGDSVGDSGCGCRTAGGAGISWLLALVLFARRRR